MDPLARIVDPADFLDGSEVKIFRVPYIAPHHQTPQICFSSNLISEYAPISQPVSAILGPFFVLKVYLHGNGMEKNKFLQKKSDLRLLSI